MASPARYRSTATLGPTPGKTSWFGLATVICNVGLLTACPESAGPVDVIDGRDQCLRLGGQVPQSRCRRVVSTESGHQCSAGGRESSAQ